MSVNETLPAREAPPVHATRARFAQNRRDLVATRLDEALSENEWVPLPLVVHRLSGETRLARALVLDAIMTIVRDDERYGYRIVSGQQAIRRES
jgi:hypothetical protein